ncbi:MAG TPA: archaeosortase/exosortase family protein [Thermoplasmata archaeon]|nr:archaeosortase/exosortase family protein [Thermoplasmata archaeon]
MGLPPLGELGVRYRKVLLLAALVSAFAGVDLALNRPKGSELQWLALPFLAGGAGLFAWAVWPRGVATAQASTPSLATELLRRLTFGGRLIPYFPVIGIAAIVADLAYNAVLSATPALLTEDTIVLLAASTLLAYGFVPARYARERDFVLVFFLALNAVLVVPLMLSRAVYQDFERSVDVYSWVALAPQTGFVLSLLGVANTVHPVAGSTAPGLTFVPPNLGSPVTVVITTACSGIYSFGIFAAAFIAFVMTDFRRPSRRMWALLGLGFLASYVANVLRMVVIVLVGYYTDTESTALQNLLLAHSYGGWLIFLGWIALFWGVLLKFLSRDDGEPAPAVAPVASRREARCSVCSEVLSPSIPAIRCACGSYAHRACLAEAGRCPACGRAASHEAAAPAGGSRA